MLWMNYCHLWQRSISQRTATTKCMKMVILSSSMLVSLVNGTNRSNPDSTDWAFLLAHCPVEPCTRWAPSSQTGRWLTSHRDPSSGQSVMSWAKLLIEHTVHAGRVTNNIEANTYLPQSLVRYERRIDGQTLIGKTNQKHQQHQQQQISIQSR